ncbi:MAG: putative amidohydrolase [Pirellulaceae bacterium]|jgi:predicted amidohydrolase
MNSIRVATVQFQHHHADKKANLAIIERFIKDAHQAGVQMIVFPECCITGYWGLRNMSREELVELAEVVPSGSSSQQLLIWSKQYSMTIGAGLVEVSDDGQLYNSFVVAMPNGAVQCHRKIHCFISEHMASGDQYTVFDTPHGVRVGVLICYDNNIVENARACAMAGAEVLLAPHQTGGCNSGSPFAMGVIDREIWDARETEPERIEAEFKGDKGRGWLLRWLPSRAHDNGMFLIFSNGVGPDDNEVRTGNAMILDPYGRIIVETWKAGDDMLVAELDASLRERCTGVRWIRARRPELYGSLTTPTGAEQDTRTVRFE